MLVKKFEANTMKEALNMVKTQMGPEAIILSVKESQKGFGLAGSMSFEVTAAVSETQIKQKAHLEAKMPTRIKEQFQNSSARTQKQILEKAFERNTNQPPTLKMQRGSMRYIDILDDETTNAKAPVAKATQVNTVEPRVAQPIPPKPQPNSLSVRLEEKKEAEINSLKNEIGELKKLISQFQQVPQSFVGSYKGADYGIPFELSYAFEKLINLGMSDANAVEVVKSAQNEVDKELWKRRPIVMSWMAKHIMHKLECSSHPFEKKVHCFVGGVGQGKTTTLVKIASHLAIEERKNVLIVTVDTLKVGACEQLRIYAQMLNVPFAIIRTPEEWTKLATHLDQIDYVLVDFPGLSMRQPEHGRFISQMMPPNYFDPEIHFVQSAVSKDEDAFATFRKFDLVSPTDFIISNLDETNRHGLIYNLQQEFKLPLHSFGIGPRVPDDFEVATRERVIDLFFDLSNWRNKSTLNEKGA